MRAEGLQSFQPKTVNPGVHNHLASATTRPQSLEIGKTFDTGASNVSALLERKHVEAARPSAHAQARQRWAAAGAMGQIQR